MPRLKWEPGESVESGAAARLPGLAERFFARCGELLEAGSLHELRLRAKRFRYALELFRECYGPGLETRLEALRRVQQVLGDLNDCATVSGMLREGDSPEFRSFLEARARSKEKQFRAWWRSTLGRRGEAERWVEYLRRYARAPR